MAEQLDVLLITIDQWRADSLSCDGHPCASTPNIDALASRGVRFTQHYAQCWNMNLGSDADSSGGDTTDQGVGPHIGDGIATALGLASDGSKYTRVRRLSRFVKW